MILETHECSKGRRLPRRDDGKKKETNVAISDTPAGIRIRAAIEISCIANAVGGTPHDTFRLEQQVGA